MFLKRRKVFFNIAIVVFLSFHFVNGYAQKTIDFKEVEFDVESIIDISSPEDVVEIRSDVVNYLWGTDGFSSHKKPKVDKGIIDRDFDALKNLKRIDRLEIEMEFGLNSIVYHFIPEKENGLAAIYHQGHGGKFSKGNKTINAFLEKGYHVFGMSMPLIGMNNAPNVDFEHFGIMNIHSHKQMIFLKPEKGSPIKFFMEPIAVAVNYAQKFNFEKLIMVGLSGGGWTTTLYAAIDPRIDISFPVAGSLPKYVVSLDLSNQSIGDYEQFYPGLYEKANFLELYILGSYGVGRSQLQILNEFDSCCFSGRGYTTYKDIVVDRVKSLGDGNYNFYLDSSHKGHQISSEALEVIFNELNNN